MNVKELTEKYENYVIETRRHIHENPELSWEEYETTAFIKKELEALGIVTYPIPDCKTGLYAYIKGEKASERSKTILLRADIDALPVVEGTGVVYQSKKPGVMHACGHDNHVAMLLGAAKVLAELKSELAGTVKLFFQPAEETAQGAKFCIEKGIMKDVDLCYSCHVSSFMEAGTVNMEAGARLASADLFSIKIKGKAAHGSAPHESHDAIAAAANVINSLQFLVSRINDPMEPLVVTVGTVHAGTRYNIIAGEAEMTGTVRCYSAGIRASLPSQIENAAKIACAALGCECEVEYTLGTAAIINDKKMASLAACAMEKTFGKEHVVDIGAVTASDDFAECMEYAPGCFAFIGIANKELDCVYNHHNEKFNVDESALKYGTALYAQVAVDALREYSE